MADVLVRGMGLGNAIRALAVNATETARAIAAAHGAAPTAAAALARVASGALLLGGTIKGRGQVGLQIKGDGLLGEIYAVADAHGNVRVSIDDATIHLASPFDGSYSVGAAVGNGALTVTKSVGDSEPYRGIVPLVSGEIAEDLAAWFLQSEQKPAAVALGERLEPEGILVAGGFLLQAFPGVDEALLVELEERLGGLPPVSAMLAGGDTPEDMLRRLLPDLVVLDSYPVQFVCTCSRERSERILLALGAEELERLIDEQEDTELLCHFCNSAYSFDRAEVGALLAAARGTLH